jgi:arabinofuranan 3-O-arabinosyltransferase
VAADGSFALPRPVRARTFRLTVLDARFPEGATRRQRATRAVGIGSLAVPGVRAAGAATSGPLRAVCGDARVEVGAREVPLRPRGTVAELEAGRPLRAGACAGDVRMGDGTQEIRSLRGTLTVDLLRLRSPAPRSLPPASGGGRVLDPGRLGTSSVDGVRVALDDPSWLVLGQSFSKGWEASCDGRALGEPVPVNGYANGWRAPADCRRVAFTFAPQDSAEVGYAISAAVCLALLAFLAGGRLAGRRWPGTSAPWPLLPEGRPERMALTRAAAIAFVATIPLSFLFAARTSVVIFPLLTLILWRGVGSRLLTAVAAGLLGIAVPLIYALFVPKDRGGFNFEYSRELIGAHWVAVLALILLVVVCRRALAAARAASEPPDPLQPAPVPPVPEERDLAGVGRRQDAGQ